MAQPRSLRWRLALGQALVLLAVLAAFSAVLFWGAQRYLYGQLDRHLHIDAETAQQSLRWTGAAFEWREAQHADSDAFDTEPFVEVYAVDGRLLHRRVPKGTEAALSLPAGPGAPGHHSRRAGGLPLRVGVERFPLAGWPDGVWLRVVRSEAPLRAELAALARGLALAALLLGVLAAGSSWWQVGRALRPLWLLSRQMQRIGAAPGPERVALPAAASEVAVLAQEFNAMLDRLEASYRQIEGFAADCAHALRTPLTALQLRGERHLSRLDDPAARAALGEMLEEADRLALRINRLLLLARAENRAASAPLARVDLAALVDSTVQLMAPLAQQHGVALQAQAAPVAAWADALWLQQMLQDLVHNAILHAGPGAVCVASTAQAAGSIDAATACIEVRDQGPGLPAAVLRSLDLPAWPGASTAGSTHEGTRLGLKMAGRLAQTQGGRLELLPNHPTGTLARVTLRAA